MKFKMIICAIGVSLAGMTGYAQTNSVLPAPPPTGVDKVVQEIKNPVPWLNWGGDLRLRNEYFHNALTLGSNLPMAAQDYFRFRGRLWTTVTPLTNVAFYARLAAEPRFWEDPAYAKAFAGQTGIEWRYGIVDGANIKLSNLFDIPLNLTVGRQDIQIGEPLNWWLVADGTPCDGSWTLFFNAARLIYEAKPIKTKFDVIYLQNRSNPDDGIPTMGPSQGYALTEQNEQGVVVHAANTALKNTLLEGYFIWKNDTQVLASGDNGNIYTFGGHLTHKPTAHIVLSAEGAYQFGSKRDPTVIYPVNLGTESRAINAFGCNARASYLFNDSFSNQVNLVAEFLSGDDPNTQGTDEMFDILWGRYPRWSELTTFYYAPETGGRSTQMNNLQRLGANWSCSPIRRSIFSLGYNALFAFEAGPTRRTNGSASQFSYDSTFRGNMLQTYLKYQFNKYISGHLWGEWVFQGDFYTQGETMTFLRAELMFTF